MLQPNPENRPSAREALQHQWFHSDKDIIRDLLQMNEIMCEEPGGNNGGRMNRNEQLGLDPSEEQKDESHSQSDISQKILALCGGKFESMAGGHSRYGRNRE